MTMGHSHQYVGQQEIAKEEDVKRYLVAALLVVLGALAGGCGGSGALSAEEYFDELE